MAINFQIVGQGTPTPVDVSRDAQLYSVAEIHEQQHHQAVLHGQAYQVQGIDTGITAKTQTILHIKNTSATRTMVLSFIRMQAITAGTYPSTGELWELGMGDTVSSGGTALTAQNTHPLTGKAAEGTFTGIDPTMAGTMDVFDTQAPKDNGQEITYNKHGSIILGLNDTFSVRYTSASTGWAKARATFVMALNEAVS